MPRSPVDAWLLVYPQGSSARKEGDLVEFPNIQPKINDGVTSDWETFPIMTSTNPPKIWRKTDARKITLELEFRVESDLEKDVLIPVSRLRAMAYPDSRARASITIPTPLPVILHIGQLIPYLMCAVMDVQVAWLEPYDPGSALPYGADVTISLESLPGLFGAGSGRRIRSLAKKVTTVEQTEATSLWLLGQPDADVIRQNQFKSP